jgi:hypothetical protein
VQTESGTLAATGELVYNVRAQPAA